MLWASRNKHRGRHAAAAATEGGREGGRKNIYKMKSQQAKKIWNSFFFYCIIRTVSGRKGCACSFVGPKVYFQEEDSCLAQIDSPAVPLTVFTAVPSAPDVTHIEDLRDGFSFTPWNTSCVASCVSTSDSRSPLTAWWEMVDYCIGLVCCVPEVESSLKMLD